MDRFMLKLSVSYPTLEEELEIIARSAKKAPELKPVCTLEQLEQARALNRHIKVTDVLMRYIVALVRATRDPKEIDPAMASSIEFGASPRASIALAAAARAHAFLDGRGYALPEDVKAIAPDVLRHRILPTYEAEADGLTPDALIVRLLEKVEQP